MIAGELPKAAADLNRMLNALEAYIGVTAPSGSTGGMGSGGDPSGVQSTAPSAAAPPPTAAKPAAATAPPQADAAGEGR
jgi:hypothetical protein